MHFQEQFVASSLKVINRVLALCHVSTEDNRCHQHNKKCVFLPKVFFFKTILPVSCIGSNCDNM